MLAQQGSPAGRVSPLCKLCTAGPAAAGGALFLPMRAVRGGANLSASPTYQSLLNGMYRLLRAGEIALEEARFSERYADDSGSGKTSKIPSCYLLLQEGKASRIFGLNHP